MAYAIFDEALKKGGGTALGMSEDLAKEIADGKVKTAETLQELAEILEVNAAGLEATLEKWNADVAAGTDSIFAKKVGLKPIEEGPFYAVRVTETNLGSVGGVRINTDCRVLDVNGEVIPRLYAAGMVAGGFIGPYYPGSGTALCSTVCFGRISAKNAVAEEALV